MSERDDDDDVGEVEARARVRYKSLHRRRRRRTRRCRWRGRRRRRGSGRGPVGRAMLHRTHAAAFSDRISLSSCSLSPHTPSSSESYSSLAHHRSPLYSFDFSPLVTRPADPTTRRRCTELADSGRKRDFRRTKFEKKNKDQQSAGVIICRDNVISHNICYTTKKNNIYGLLK